jgi:hypothetical protein
MLTAGLGGGLDVVNASLVYFIAKQEQKQIRLGSVRPVVQNRVENSKPFHANGTHVDGNTNVKSQGRYLEPVLAKYFNEEVLLFSRTSYNPEGKTKSEQEFFDQSGLRGAIQQAVKQHQFEHCFFIDGGGDSLILKPSDVSKEGTTESNSGSGIYDVFRGGDAEFLRAVYGLPNIYQGIISVGLDVDERNFQENIQLLKAKGGYYGKVNLVTLEKEDWKLGHLLKLENNQFLQPYFELCEKFLVLTKEHCKDNTRMMSHTATVTYHALKGNFGVHRTFVPWEPTQPDGTKGVLVKPEHQWMYFLNPSVAEDIKRELNPEQWAKY